MKLEQYMEYIRKYEIPPEPPYMPRDSLYAELDHYKARDECTSRGLWTVIADTWVAQLAEWIGERKCVEVMAGAGWLAKALQNHNVDVWPTDNYSWNQRHSKMQFLTGVTQTNATAAVKSAKDAEILIVSWPPYGGTAIVYACNEWDDRGYIVYIGEKQWGCNAPDSFFERFWIPDDTPRIHLPQWPGLHDEIMIGIWRKK